MGLIRCTLMAFVLLAPMVAGAGQSLIVRPKVAWKAAAEFLEGSFIPIARDDKWLYLDHEQRLQRRSLRKGSLGRVYSSGDCQGPLVDLRVGSGRLIALREILPSEESMAPGHPPAARDTCLQAFHLKSGKLAWQKEGDIKSGMVLGAGKLIISRDGDLSALDLKRGKRIWHIPGAGGSGLVSAGGRLFVIEADAAIAAYKIRSGKLIWRTKLEGQPSTTAVAGDERLFVAFPRVVKATSGTELLALDLATGRMRWTRLMSGQKVETRPLFFAKIIFWLTSGDGDQAAILHAMSADSGGTRWQAKVSIDWNGHDFSPVACGDDLLIWSGDLAELEKHAVSLHYYLKALDLRTGTERFRLAPKTEEKFIFSRPICALDNIYFTDGWWVQAVRWPKPAKPKPMQLR
jgi:outer membrane protein assembly factor BamB